MRISILTESGDIHTIEVDSQMELENIKALLEADCNIPADEQILLHNEVELSDPKSTLEGNKVVQDDILTLYRRVKNPRTTNIAAVPSSTGGPSVRPGQLQSGGGDPHNAEQIRQHLLSNPAMLQQLRANQPELAAAAESDPNRFHELIRELDVQRQQAESARSREIARLNADPFDIEAQSRIEEAIRLENVAANLEAAMEFNPESFGRVTMLYIDVEVNGHPVKAFVDSGAQATIMSPSCAETCGIMRLVDRRFAGVARGVGVAKILGRVHSAQIRVGQDLFLACSFTIMEGKGVDLLFGLDMLKRHQACIDLKKDCLVINGTEIRFLSEHELPSSARETAELTSEEMELINKGASSSPSASGEGTASASTPSATISTTEASGSSAPVSAPVPAPAPVRVTSAPQSTSAPADSSSEHFPEEHIQTLMGLGATREQVIAALNAAGGDMDTAAGFLF
ncbi:DNA damage-inducible protein 1 [Lunasporangiospora selenospora]|uniref:DNA damage-inducible protein 1 n=1 Tax=Lunasporangiospora selenospora TaxID=979761 RepID=A0A9P6G143_9FUNG|nr:DNA damage-inducible protein 1 [Lunasporangiospora selenospora]